MQVSPKACARLLAPDVCLLCLFLKLQCGGCYAAPISGRGSGVAIDAGLNQASSLFARGRCRSMWYCVVLDGEVVKSGFLVMRSVRSNLYQKQVSLWSGVEREIKWPITDSTRQLQGWLLVTTKKIDNSTFCLSSLVAVLHHKDHH